jgi:thymidylate synthase (FAD)
MKIADIKVDYLGHYGSDLTVANAARVSFHKSSDWEWGRMLSEKDAKLINYLARNGHTSPFNHAFLSVRVKAPIFVARQLVKHKFMPWNEVSRRYVDEEPEFYVPEARKRAENVKQGSGDELVGGVDMKHYGHEPLQDYKDLLSMGVAPEVARAVLPQTMMTEWWWSGTLGAFADMLRLRLDPHTQKESRDVANLILPIVEEHFPISIKALLA